MKKGLEKIFFASVFLVFLVFPAFFSANPLSAGQEDKLKELNRKIQEYEQKISQLQGEQKTLASAIEFLNSKIQLTTTQIAVTEQELKILGEEIAKLSVKIDILDESLFDVSEILSSRIQETYKRSLINPVYLFFSSGGFGEVLSRLYYLRIVQNHDRNLLFQMQKSKMNYDVQKELKVEKQEKEKLLKEQLENQQAVLDQQKKDKSFLLEKTRND